MVGLIQIIAKIGVGVLLVLASTIVGARILQLSSASDPHGSLVLKETALSHDLRSALINYDGTNGLGSELDSRRLFQAAPLSPLPFVVGMINATEAGDRESEVAYAMHALKLHPRGEAARLQLADIAAREGNFETAFAQLSSLVVLDRPRRDLYLDAMARLAQLPQTWPYIDDALKQQPSWGPRLLNRLSDTIEDKYFFDQLYSYYPRLQDKYVQALGARGDWDDAFVSYVTYLDPEQLNGMSVPFDSHFENLPAPQPFNWSVAEQYADLEDRGGLYVSFFGRGNPKIVWQTLVLTPGAYQLSSAISGQTYRNGGSLKWQISCLDNSATLGAVEINELETAGDIFTLNFDVPPADCSFQTLALRGVAGEFPRTLRAEIDYVSIEPVGNGT
ncbi:MAG: hypothetical protein AAFV54_05515 [Pseudomonadota bacterium]